MSSRLVIVSACVLVSAGARAARADGGDPAAAERAAYEKARPVFERYCTKCHAPSSPGADDQAIEHLDMGSYPFGGHHAAEAGAEVREALGATGEQPTMPDDEPGAVTGGDLALVLAWADAFDAAHPHASDDMHGMHGMDMHDMDMHDMDMHMDDAHGGHAMGAMASAPLGLSMAREGSGTAWQPDATAMAMHDRMAGGWMLMLHYSLHAGYDAQSSPRGDDKLVGLGWVMGMASHALAGGDFTARAMLSPEPLVLGKRGYPLLLQTGEEVGGVPLVDRQHPHDLFMELALRYAHPIGDDVAAEIYVAPAGEPALGPVAFPHRPYALYDMTATLGHHWQDSSHISFGVVTAGVYTRAIKLEGSWFNGREPDEDRYDINLRRPDSFSGRVTVNPSEAWSVELSYGYLTAPESTEPDVDVQRVVGSVMYAGRPGGHRMELTAVAGRNIPSKGAPGTSAALIESDVAVDDHVVVFGRAELLQKVGSQLDVAPVSGVETVFDLGALSVGAVYELALAHDVTIGVGARGTVDLIGDLRSAYGTSAPVGGLIYVEAHPTRAK